MLEEWRPEDNEPPLSFEECSRIAMLEERGAKCDGVLAAKAAADLLGGYVGQTKKWERTERDRYIDQAIEIFREHHPRAVHAVVKGPERIQKTATYVPTVAELAAALKEAERIEKMARSRARLAVAMYAAMKVPGLLDSSQMHLFRRTKDGEAAIQYVKEATSNG